MRLAPRSVFLATVLVGLSMMLAPSGYAASAPLPAAAVAQAVGRVPTVSPMPQYRLDQVYSIRATATSRYVSAELGAPIGVYGLLRARATTVGDWEKFYVAASIGPGGVATNPYNLVSAANHRFVKTDPRLPGFPPSAYDGMLRASADPTDDDPADVSPRLNFELVPIGPQDVALRCANGLFVSAEFGYTGANFGMLRCRATTVGAWERFDLRVFGPAPPLQF